MQVYVGITTIADRNRLVYKYPMPKKKPVKEVKPTITIRVDWDTYDFFKRMAVGDGRTLIEYLRRLSIGLNSGEIK